MSRYEQENKKVSQCVTLLKEFIEGSRALDSQKGIARLALAQLQRVNAGTDSNQDLRGGCWSRPRIEGGE